MSQCPSCGASVDEDFGLVNCRQCGAVLFVEFDGSVRMGDESPEAASQASGVVEAEPAVEVEESVFMPPDLPAEPVQEDSQSELASQNFGMETAMQENLPEVPASGEDFSEELLEQVEPQVAVNDQPFSEANMDEVIEFANSEESLGQDGLLRFDIVIDGIDTADIRNSLREVMEDRKFLWDAEGLLKEVQEGRLKISAVPSVKASVFLNRIKNLPLEISWEQHAIIEA